ncbi:sugar ABC transporter ATP-binding protein [Fimbriimonas ginsengisoli]|uniref:ABC transporter-related protein n=1 Tax=Fimbriimonas ginsengisoli Gsoil 348 TaxID=661478 RepID=A0A068NSR1_FIMGI|nr:sugar ABC transporter ATP-binding protein [Fimbriimonas ginsengisoli]AIE84649.1 ABC transporter-related protein [Fimbriimonas ginsengisoli Gsoil 348]
MSQPTEETLLEMRSISKAFGSFRALDNVDFHLRTGEIHALLGENGAGKSTLIKVMTGVLPPDSGEIRLSGQAIRPRSPLDAQALGIASVYQEVNLLPNLSVAENVMFGRMPQSWRGIDWKKLNRQAEEALAVLNLEIDVRMPLGSYSIAIQQLVAIARAISTNVRVLVLDEPTSSLDEAEVEGLFVVLRRLQGRGIGIVFITHFLDQVDAVADRITVLRNGKLVGEYPSSSLSRVELVSKMIGKELGAFAAEQQSVVHATEGAPLLQAEGLRKKRVGPVDLAIRAGETVGLAGLLGSGRTETARMLFGLDRPDGGALRYEGADVHFRAPRAAMRKGLGYLPEDRKLEAIIPSLSIRENVALALQAKRGWLRRMSQEEQRALAEKYRQALGIATDSIEKPIGQLSGGNQQKVILARWLATEPNLLILDEPTRGIDVGAREEIERLIASLCRDGMGMLMISSEIDELLRCADRLVVLHEGRQVGELPSSATDEQVMHLIAGGGA